MKTVLIKSEERYDTFKKILQQRGSEVIELDFRKNNWVDYNYEQTDLLIYYPSFDFSSNHPQAIWKVADNLAFIADTYPNVKMYPDPGLLWYYNDKYRQFLLLNKHKFPVPDTVPLYSEDSIDLAEEKLGYPMVLKNRFGAGGDYVFKVNNRKDLEKYVRIASLDLFNLGAASYFYKILSKRLFYYFLIKAKRSQYPLLSFPLLSQRFIEHNRDLKLVLFKDHVIEGHWRSKAGDDMWKVNIDGGGIGEWSFTPDSALTIGKKLAAALNSTWVNIDLFSTAEGFLISEFSPVWHHYAYKEKSSFIYRDDYNLDIPIKESLELEKLITESLINNTV